MITFEALKDRGFSEKNISNEPIYGACIRCEIDFHYSNVKKFMRNRRNKPEKSGLWSTCPRCWLKINTSEDPQWIKKNSDAQKIAQNKPEQKRKNAEGVSKSWTTERRNEASKSLKERWKNDPEFSKKALKNLIPHNSGENVKMGYGTGGLRGIYSGMKYDSALELSFILWCNHKNVPIRRYDYPPVTYNDEDGIRREYHPDFIINDNEIVEIKGSGLWFKKNYKRNQLKSKAAKQFFRSYIVLFDRDETVKTFYRTARKIHHEAKE